MLCFKTPSLTSPWLSATLSTSTSHLHGIVLHITIYFHVVLFSFIICVHAVFQVRPCIELGLGSRHVLHSFPGSKHRNEGAMASYQLLFNLTPEVHETHSEESGAVLDAHLPEKTLGILERKLLTVRMGIPFFSSCMRAMTSSI